ncbi:MAG: hypothetical protein FWF84_01150, partial [Kiritimatiellaeota bacterium]|nr:hypothetical protein [Kiritimatiellota bacterium]
RMPRGGGGGWGGGGRRGGPQGGGRGGERPREPQEDGMEGERPREPQEDPEDDDELPPPPPPSRTNALDVAGGTLLPAAPAVGATIYVDAARGDDAWTGRSAQPRGGGEGPKRTLAAGLSAAGRGGRLVIAAGDYTEKLDVRGTGVRVTVTGNASFGTAAERRVSKGARAPAAPLAIPPAAAPTGTVVNAFN